MVDFYILSKRLHVKRKGLFHARTVSLTTKEYGFAVYL